MTKLTAFLDNFPDDDILESLGDEVSYTVAGGISKIIRAIVHDGNENSMATDSYVPEKHIIIDVLKTDATAISKGDTFIYGGKTLTVDAVQNDDGSVMTVVVH